jgi:cellulose synthase/poly-beta-1,6-N-acetylglucosamine synthase-like glycosyltransferase
MIVQVLFYITLIFQIFIASYLLLPLFLLLTTFFANIVHPHNIRQKKVKPYKNYKFGLVVTAHQETKFLPPIVDSMLKQTYSNFETFIVADDCDITGLHFDDNRIHLLKPKLPLNTNTRSIRHAVDRFSKDIDIMVLFDPDNLLHPEFLEKLNTHYNKGYLAVQGNLLSKTVEGTYEQMDNVGVLFYNFIDRTARTAMDLSVNIWGCGVSVRLDIYKKIRFTHKSIMGGFDKFMQAEIVKMIPTLGYAEDAIFYDEKISDAKNLESQRTRWINAYFKFFIDGFKVFLLGLKRGNFNLAFFGYNLIRPPYFLIFAAGIVFFLFSLLMGPGVTIFWACTLATFLCSFLFIVTRKMSKDEVQGIFYMPLFFYHQVRSLLRLRANKTSILKTEHNKVLYINDILEKTAPEK